MAFIPILLPEHASDVVRTIYEEFYMRMSFPAPPNFIMTQGHSATVARGTWSAVEHILVMGEIPRWIKEMMWDPLESTCRHASLSIL